MLKSGFQDCTPVITENLYAHLILTKQKKFYYYFSFFFKVKIVGITFLVAVPTEIAASTPRIPSVHSALRNNLSFKMFG